MDTLELQIKLTPKDPWSDILIAELSELGFDSFVNTEEGLMAYAPASIDLDDVKANSSLNGKFDFKLELTEKIIPYQNWNAKWESEFEPVYVEDYATIVAPFHSNIETKGLSVIIQPQMSFGTGHHQTTWLMTKALFELNKMPDNVLDMGTGTGVLAVVVEKLGAKRILAIDIEDWSVENAVGNVALNDCTKVELRCGDADKIGAEKFGLIIANINKNILKSHMKQYADALFSNGTLLLSGFFNSDVNELVNFAAEYGLIKKDVLYKDEWAMIRLEKK